MQSSEQKCHPSRSQEVMDAARYELELLVRQRKAINQRLKTAQRTVKGLTILFGEVHLENAGISGGEGGAFPEGPLASIVDTAITYDERASHENSNQTSSEVRAKEETVSPADKCNPRLARACRIALLESETPATATDVYDRIMRRGSYQLSRYKYPLLRVIETLNRLTEKGDAESLVDSEYRGWRWSGSAENRTDSDSFSALLSVAQICKTNKTKQFPGSSVQKTA